MASSGAVCHFYGISFGIRRAPLCYRHSCGCDALGRGNICRLSARAQVAQLHFSRQILYGADCPAGRFSCLRSERLSLPLDLASCSHFICRDSRIARRSCAWQTRRCLGRLSRALHHQEQFPPKCGTPQIRSDFRVSAQRQPEDWMQSRTTSSRSGQQETPFVPLQPPRASLRPSIPRRARRQSRCS